LNIRAVLCDTWNAITGIQPVLAFALGLAGAYFVVWSNHVLRDDLLRRATREALAIELLTNLQLLDNYERDLNAIQQELATRWPSEPPLRTVLDNTSEPLVSVVLTDTEKVRFALLGTQLRVLWTALVVGREDVDRPTASRQFPSRQEVMAAANRITNTNILEVTGRQIIETLLIVISKQDFFSLSATIEIAQRLEKQVIGRAVWRTSDIGRWSSQPGITVAWRNDSPSDELPAGTIVLLDGRMDTFSVVDLEKSGWAIRFVPFNRRWRSFRGNRADTQALERVRLSQQ
jgi:hypothetical protein